MRSDGPRRARTFLGEHIHKPPRAAVTAAAVKSPAQPDSGRAFVAAEGSFTLNRLTGVVPWNEECLSPYLCLHGEGREGSPWPCLFALL